MPRNFIRFATPLVVFAAAGCQQAGPVSAEGAWVRLPAVSGRPAAAYFAVHGGGDANTLVAVSTPIAVRAELHESMKGEHGMMSMKPITDVPVPAGGTVAFEPGGKHVMLFDIDPAATAGKTAPITLSFADGAKVTVTAKLVAPGEEP